MWRRSGVLTDAEITEIRYSGKAAAFLRGFKAIYFGVFINCLTMAWVIAAMVKISQAFFDWPASWVIAGCITVSVTYTTLGGFRSVVITDFIQFFRYRRRYFACHLCVIRFWWYGRYSYCGRRIT